LIFKKRLDYIEVGVEAEYGSHGKAEIGAE